ncbi:MAG: 23S rRNA pseudouridine(1911/1915/1917) synthase RluD [Gammaproteobacteria bacterium]
MQHISLTAKISEELAGKRLDQAVSALFPDYSRTRLQEWIKSGELKVDGKTLEQREKVIAGQIIEINATVTSKENWQAQDLKLDVIYEDADILVINKPIGLVVHPAHGNYDNTLLNALLYYAPELASVPRAGIIHRLDKDTSGLLLVARNLESHTKLTRLLKDHNIEREYEAIVVGVMTSGGTVDAPIGRNPHKRLQMAVLEDSDEETKEAVTHYRVLERFSAHTRVKLQLETGRTHQIRVHLAHIGYPIVGDKTYGGRMKLPTGASAKLIETLRSFPRQALHACRLSFKHPRTGKKVEFKSPIPEDIKNLINLLRP